uniref:DUF2177 family protein n=1 Tax=viral metagenome TaxID=1070528 RepID=A0A6C0LL09_9ZZZZ
MKNTNQIAYLLAAVLLVVLDSVYLNLVKQYYNYQIKSVQGSDMKINLSAAILCYVFLVFGINYFIIREKKSVLDAFLLGLTIYAVYELTSMALLKKWSWLTVIMDTTWGGILFGLTTYLVYLIF